MSWGMSILGCAACYGQSDSPMALGMNWGIMSLLLVLGVVFGGVTAFFLYLAKRAASVGLSTAGPSDSSLSRSAGARELEARLTGFRRRCPKSRLGEFSSCLPTPDFWRNR
jgi:hypothetical protein